MKIWRLYVAAAVCLLVASGCQQVVAPRLPIGGAFPDFLLVSIACLSLFASRTGSLCVGFVAGLLHGAMAGTSVAAYAISRSVAGFACGSLIGAGFDRTLTVAFLSGLLATLISHVIRMFLAPPEAIVPFLLATIASAIYNGVLAVPLFAFLKRVLGAPTR